MDRYMAIDAGKFATKFAVYNPETKGYIKGRFRTKISTGDFRDDNIEKGTYLIETDGKTYKVGNGATQETRLELTKISEEHRISALVALASMANNDDVFHIAIGCPVKEYQNVAKREEYKRYMLPDGKVSVKLKLGNDKEIEERHFTIASKVVYAESIGILYIDPIRFNAGTTGVIDIGGGTALGIIAEGFEINAAYSMTTELGGNVLVSELAQELSAQFGRVDTSLAAKLLKRPSSERYLSPVKKNPEVEQESKAVIHDYLINYLNRIRRACDAKSWSLDYLDLVFTGGTSEALAEELREVFGSDIYIPKNSEFTNVIGFLKKLVARELKEALDTGKDFSDISEPDDADNSAVQEESEKQSA